MKNKKNKKLSRRSFLQKAGAAALAAPVSPMLISGAAANAKASVVPGFPMVQSGTNRKRNVLFIATDDMCNRLGCYDVPVIKSPNLDRLARSGVRFDHHYCQYPLCGPSRTSLMTGLAPDTTKVYDLRTDFRETTPGTVTVSQLFQKNGYFTARAGKIYHYNNPSEIGTPGFDDPASWQKVSYPAGYDRTHDEGLVTFWASNQQMFGGRSRGGSRRSYRQILEQLQKQSRNGSGVLWRHGGLGPGGIRLAQDGCTPLLPLSKNGDLGIALAGHPSTGDDKIITDFMVAEAAIAMMEEHKNDPFFIAAGFFRPHVPFIVPSKYYDMYPVDQMQIPPFDPSELKIAPRIAYNTINPNYGMTQQQHRECLRGYYAAISFVDAQVGRLLDALERLNLAKDTTIVFWADHGFMVGEHGQWEKTMLFDPAARVPFLMAGAGVPSAGKGVERTTEHLDIYPTLVELCGLQGAPTNLQGRSLVPLLQNPNASWDYPALSQVEHGGFFGPNPHRVMGYSVRTERYRYTIWNGGADGEELYDYQVDPRELHNLAKDSGAAGVKARLRASLERIGRERGMPGSSTSGAGNAP